ncbi:acetyltransferase [Effusibacillus pohliae]|uniref:acetyltransferase n=1 Tax=Effusibacillus pohliae TaxID=232270 RepID=UPI000372FE28|nr:acetyltransferase [Effusibacillus pohliae]
MSRPVIVLGGGGHAKVLIDTLLLQNRKVLGVTVPVGEFFGKSLLGIRCIGNDDTILEYPADSIELVNGIGSVAAPDLRKRIFESFKGLGYEFTSVVHPSAVISAEAELAEGVQVMAGAIIQTGSSIGANTIVNTKVSVDHDCAIGNHVHLAPGVTLSGGVQVGDEVHIGTGATVIQGVRIGKNSIIGAGALVLNDVAEGVTVVGVPAKEVQR